MQISTKEDFDDLVTSWRYVVEKFVTYYKDTDFQFLVTHDTNTICYDAKYGNTKLTPKWVLEHCDVITDRGLWREFFDTEEELYEWGCNYLLQQIKKYNNPMDTNNFSALISDSRS